MRRVDWSPYPILGMEGRDKMCDLVVGKVMLGGHRGYICRLRL